MPRKIRIPQNSAGLTISLSKNPVYIRKYFDYFVKYTKKKPATGRTSPLSVLISNPVLGEPEINQLFAIIAATDYGVETKNLNPFLRRWEWMLYDACLSRPDLTEEHHAIIRREVARILDLFESEEYYRKYKLGKQEFIHQEITEEYIIPLILSKVRLDDQFVRYLFEHAGKKENGGVLFSGLLPNPELSKGDYDRNVKVLRKQYVGKEHVLFRKQGQPLYAERVYGFWAASPYVR